MNKTQRIIVFISVSLILANIIFIGGLNLDLQEQLLIFVIIEGRFGYYLFK